MATRLRTTSIILSSTFLMLTAGWCADGQEPDTAQVCMERDTLIRLPEQQCPPDETGVTGTGHHVWVWQKGYVPAVGSRLSGFSTVKTGIVGTAPQDGGYVGSSGG